MLGPEVITRTLSTSRSFGPSGSMYQYHSRSDHHSKLCCWVIAVDLLQASALMRRHAADGKITIGVNHEMVDFKLSRKKNLDLVIARPSHEAKAKGKSMTLAEIADKEGFLLSPAQRADFNSLPEIRKQAVGSVLVALEAKACMTEHGKSEPRLYDELNSSQQTVHGAADQAIAVGLAMVNIADTFISPGRQKVDGVTVVTKHKQPDVSESVIRKLRQLPRRSAPGTEGFDALGILVVSLANDGSPVRLHADAPAPASGDGDTYAEMITRTAALYDYRFASI